MAYDEKLADRVRRVLPPSTNIQEQKMFGGVAFLLDGKMFAGITNRDLMVRVGPDGYEAALARPNVRPMDFTGRPLKGYVFVGAAGTRTDGAVAVWIRQAMRFVDALPAKANKRRRSRPRPRPQRKPKRAASRNARRSRASS